MSGLDQHPEAAPPCAKPTGAVNPGAPEFLCQRGQGHPGTHEVMLLNGCRIEWGLTSQFPDEVCQVHKLDGGVHGFCSQPVRAYVSCVPLCLDHRHKILELKEADSW